MNLKVRHRRCSNRFMNFKTCVIMRSCLLSEANSGELTLSEISFSMMFFISDFALLLFKRIINHLLSLMFWSSTCLWKPMDFWDSLQLNKMFPGIISERLSLFGGLFIRGINTG